MASPQHVLMPHADGTATLWSRAVRAARLDRQVYAEVVADRSALGQAAVVVAVATVATVLADLVQGHHIIGLVRLVAGVPGWVVGAWFLSWVGTTLLGATPPTPAMSRMLRTTGFASAPAVFAVLGAVPQVGAVLTLAVALWQGVASVIAVREALAVSTWRAIGTVVVAGLIGIVIGGIAGLVVVSVVY